MEHSKEYGDLPEVPGVKFVPVYQVMGQTDRTEGRGPLYIVGYATDMAEATRMAQDKGTIGTPGTIKTVMGLRFPNGEVFVLGERIDTAWKQQVLRDRAKAKLTPEELNALLVK